MLALELLFTNIHRALYPTFKQLLRDDLRLITWNQSALGSIAAWIRNALVSGDSVPALGMLVTCYEIVSNIQ